MRIACAQPGAVIGPGSRLELLLGPGRARILAALHTPQTTLELALALGLAASTVSAHLTALVDAGLLSRERAGRSVYYQHNSRAEALIALMSSD
jgi:DNA-binding transcriptional ArsR family regulator